MHARFGLCLALLGLGVCWATVPGCGRIGFDVLVSGAAGGGGGIGDAAMGGAPAVGQGGGAGVGSGGGTAGVGGGGAGVGGGPRGGGAGAGGAPDAAAGGQNAGGTDAGPPDGPVAKPVPTCTPRRFWRAEFDQDPTTTDVDGDGVKDWSNNRGGPSTSVPVTGDGLWRPSGTSVVVDTRPLDPFDRRTILAVRFQNLSLDDPQNSLAWGALAWVNLLNDGPQMLAVYLSLRREQPGSQTLRLRARGATATNDVLASFPGLPERLVEAVLDADPIGKTVDLWIDGEHKGQWSIPIAGPALADDFATMATFFGASLFDYVRVTICE